MSTAPPPLTLADPPGVARSAQPPATGTVSASGTGSARTGLLEGRGLADTLWVVGPGRPTSVGETVKTWIVGGREATNRAGAAEHLGLSCNSVTQYASPSGRRTHGWPEPLPERPEGHEVFALAELDAFAATRAGTRPAPAVTDGEDLDRLIGVDEFAELRGIKRDTLKRYVEDSLNAWQRGEDGYLPHPDAPPRPGPVQGFVYEWKLGTALAWTAPATRRTGGRTPGPAPTRADLAAALAELGDTAGERPKVREIAAAMTERLQRPVSSQTVRRLLRPADETRTK